MPRSSAFPKYRHHKSTRRAYVVLLGRAIYLGAYGSRESLKRYDRLKYEQASSSAPCLAARGAAGAPSIKVKELALAYLRHADRWYFRPDRPPATEPQAIRQALRPLVSLYSNLDVQAFGPRQLKAVRAAMAERGWARTNINRQITRVCAMFKWGVEDEMVPPGIYQSLKAVRGLPRGRSEGVRESEAVHAVSESVVEQVLPLLPVAVAAMVRLQLLTGMRPGEVTAMRWNEIDRSGATWMYTPRFHKNTHRGHHRKIPFGPRAQAVLNDFQQLDLTAHVFSPQVSEAKRRCRSSPRRFDASIGDQPADALLAVGRRRPGTAYTVNSYRRAITRGCAVAFPAPSALRRRMGESAKSWKARLSPDERAELNAWCSEHSFHPHQLRHTAAERFRHEHGLDAAQALLGHKDLRSTEHYAKVSMSKACEVMASCG